MKKAIMSELRWLAGVGAAIVLFLVFMPPRVQSQAPAPRIEAGYGTLNIGPIGPGQTISQLKVLPKPTGFSRIGGCQINVFGPLTAGLVIDAVLTVQPSGATVGDFGSGKSLNRWGPGLSYTQPCAFTGAGAPYQVDAGEDAYIFCNAYNKSAQTIPAVQCAIAAFYVGPD